MTRTRKHHTPEFKMKAVIEILKGERTASQIAGEMEVHPTVLSEWKKQFVGKRQGYNVFPIIGARTVEQIQDNLGYDSFTLSAEQVKALDEVSAVSLGFPGEFFNSETVQKFAMGGFLCKIIPKD